MGTCGSFQTMLALLKGCDIGYVLTPNKGVYRHYVCLLFPHHHTILLSTFM